MTVPAHVTIHIRFLYSKFLPFIALLYLFYLRLPITNSNYGYRRLYRELHMKSKFGRRLTAQEKEEIRHLLCSDPLSHRAIAEKYGVTAGTISGWAVKMGLRRGRGPLSPAHPQHDSLKKAVPNV